MPLLDESIAIQRAKLAAENKGGTFVGFCGGVYSGKRTRCVLSCPHHGIWCTTLYHGLVSVGRWCPSCGGTNPLGHDRAERIAITKCEEKGYSFLGFPDGYKNSRSRVLLKCAEPSHEKWSMDLNDLRRGKGCPGCAKTGFDVNLPGWLYALASFDGEIIKVGISNYPKARIKRLKRYTPFRFIVMFCYRYSDGSKALALEKYFHNTFESAGLRDFDGATEWLKHSDELMLKLDSLETT